MRPLVVHLTCLHVAAALACAAAIGCGGDDGDADGQTMGDDGGAPDHDGGMDATPARGLKIRFAYLDALGNRVSGDQPIEFEEFRIRKITMQLHNLEFIGDTVQSGEQVDDSCVLEYPWMRPPWSDFPTAPPGIYAHLGFAVARTRSDEPVPPGFDKERLSIKVLGDVLVDAEPIPFEYTDDKKIDIDIDFDEKVSEVPTTRVLELDLERWFRYVPWRAMIDDEDEDDDNGGPGPGPPPPPGGDDEGGEDGVVLIERDDPTALILRTSLKHSFQLRP